MVRGRLSHVGRLHLLVEALVVGILVFKQKTAYEMRISDWSSDVCSSDLHRQAHLRRWKRRRRPATTHPAGSRWRRYGSDAPGFLLPIVKIGRAACRERVCQYV